MNPKRRVIPLALLGIFVVAQGLAVGARLGSVPNALFVLLQGIAVCVALGAVGMIALSLSGRHYLARFDEIIAEEGEPVWLVSRVPTTSDRLSDYLGKRVELSSFFAIAIKRDGLRVLRLPAGETVGFIDLDDLEDVRVGRVAYFGVASDCLTLILRNGPRQTELPLVLARAGRFRYLSQNQDQLTASARLLRDCAGS